MAWLPILGVLIVVLGLALGSKFNINPLISVLLGGFVSGLLGGLSVVQILEVIGSSFIANRTMILFLIMLPAIGITERHGLMEQMGHLISKLRAATPGRIAYIYQLIREVFVAIGIRIGGHAAFVRPLIYPMARGSIGEAEINEDDEEQIKAMTAASENIGNFFAQNVFPASAGLLLIQGVMGEMGFELNLTSLAKAAIPMAIVAAIYGFIYFMILDRRFKGVSK
ncbi:5-oxoproline transporter, DUF969 family subunit [Petrotoga olearia]|jgi:uncharacterized membrane protein|uniref:Membrane protein n=1 Tax=Petrotoga olearia TaxID=156203 RepID=A0ABX9UDP2_9BACT|nr:DUF969 family protein [Petrotoga olearia]KUK16113.1 MAG: Mn-containing catalase [Petrotoga mobilis]RMA73326.1 putative membrane protein [Petrotoga olearia]HBT50811.1 DUF969 domain-containing protein [Petrotoga sp.]